MDIKSVLKYKSGFYRMHSVYKYQLKYVICNVSTIDRCNLALSERAIVWLLSKISVQQAQLVKILIGKIYTTGQPVDVTDSVWFICKQL